MKVHLKRQNEGVHFLAYGSNGVMISIDGSKEAGGVEAGPRPMELLLMSLASCAAIDLVLILNKQKQVIEDLEIEVDGERDHDKTPSSFKAVEIHFQFKGTLDPAKVERAIDLSVNKYCSVHESLHPEIKIKTRFTIV